MNEPSPGVEGRKRTFSDRQRVLEEKKMQQQREEAERMRVEEEKRLKRDAKRRERKEKERREAIRVQRIDERNEVSSSYYGQNYVHPALTNKSPSKPSTVIMPEYDAFSEGMTPECIIGATDELGELCFFVKWKGTDDADFVPAKKAKIHCPQLVIRYYENIISWK